MVSFDLTLGTLLACALCGGTVDDIVVVLGSSMGLTGLAMGFEMMFENASRVFGWTPADGIGDEDSVIDPRSPAEKTEADSSRSES